MPIDNGLFDVVLWVTGLAATVITGTFGTLLFSMRAEMKRNALTDGASHNEINVGLSAVVLDVQAVTKTVNTNRQHLDVVRRDVSEAVIQMTRMNGSVKRNADRLDSHTKLDDEREERSQKHQERMDLNLDNILAKVNQ